MTPELRCSYSTIAAEALLTHVVPSYRIERPLECVFWERGANDTYRVRCAGARYSLRVYRRGAFPRDAIEFEIEVLIHLHRRGVPVAYPIARASGDYLTEIAAPEGARLVLLTAFADGAVPDYDAPENARLVGESVARMHRALDGFGTARERARLDLPNLLEDSVALIRPWLAHRPEDLRLVEAHAGKCRSAVQGASDDALDTGVCHGDLHGGNLHLHDGGITHFDFEECAFGYRAYDLATFKWGVCTGRRGAERWSAFVEGYESVRPISGADRSLIDVFVVIRELSNVAFGLRNLRDFGHGLVGDESLDELRGRLEDMSTLVAGHGGSVSRGGA